MTYPPKNWLDYNGNGIFGHAKNNYLRPATGGPGFSWLVVAAARLAPHQKPSVLLWKVASAATSEL